MVILDAVLVLNIIVSFHQVDKCKVEGGYKIKKVINLLSSQLLIFSKHESSLQYRLLHS